MENSKQPKTIATVSVDEYELFLNRKQLEEKNISSIADKLRQMINTRILLQISSFIQNVNNWLFPLSLMSILAFWLFPTVLMFSSAGKHITDPAYGLATTLAHATKNESSSWMITTYVYILYTLAWIGFVCAVRVLVCILFLYHAFLYERKTLSLRTKIWGAVARFLTTYLGGRRKLYSYQQLLPHLPVPPLRKTITRYLQSVRPLLDDAAYQQVCTLSAQFLNGEGKRFQRYLWLKWLTSPNYVTDWWERYAYLHSRTPLLINSNYYIMDNHGFDLLRRPASRAANMTYCMLKFRNLLQRQDLKPLILADVVPLCSWQHERQFDTTRIPKIDDDIIEHAKVPATHIAVLHRGRWYRLDTHCKGELLAPVELEAQFELVMADPSFPHAGEARLAALTVGERNQWAKTRARFFSPDGKKNINGDSLRVIETAAFVVALDDEVAYDYSEKDPTQFDKFASWLMCGNGANRWCDKNYTLVVTGNGRVGLNVEHSWSDGLISAVLWEYALYEDLAELGYTPDGRCRGEKSSSELLPSRLAWSLDADDPLAAANEKNSSFQYTVTGSEVTPALSLVQCIDLAYFEARALIDDTDLIILSFDEYGKDFIKTCKVSPDGFVQLMLQLAYFRDQGHFDLTYETSMTRLFLHGRTETVRPCTLQSVAFVRAMQAGVQCTNGKRRELLRDACYTHQRQYLDCMNGKGIDRHLFALYIVSKGVSKEKPSPFLESYIKDSRWKLSTSQTPRGLTDRVDENNPLHMSAGGGFGPVTPDGYGVSYVLAGDVRVNDFWSWFFPS